MYKKVVISLSFIGISNYVQAETPQGANRETTSETVAAWVYELYNYWATERVKTKGAVLLGLVINGEKYDYEFEPESFGPYNPDALEVIDIAKSFADRSCCKDPMGNIADFRALVLQQDPEWKTLAVRYSLPSGIIRTEPVNISRDYIAKQMLVVSIVELLRRYGVFQ